MHEGYVMSPNFDWKSIGNRFNCFAKTRVSQVKVKWTVKDEEICNLIPLMFDIVNFVNFVNCQLFFNEYRNDRNLFLHSQNVTEMNEKILSYSNCSASLQMSKLLLLQDISIFVLGNFHKSLWIEFDKEEEIYFSQWK